MATKLHFYDKEFCLLIHFLVAENINNVSEWQQKNIQIYFLDNKDNFEETEWKRLYKLSEETFVEETDSLKQGAAGAGLTDND